MQVSKDMRSKEMKGSGGKDCLKECQVKVGICWM